MARGNCDADDIRSAIGIAQTDYAQRTRHLVKLINELRGVGQVQGFSEGLTP